MVAGLAIKNLAIIYHSTAGSLYVRDLRNSAVLFSHVFSLPPAVCFSLRRSHRDVKKIQTQKARFSRKLQSVG